MRRRGMNADVVGALKNAYRVFYHQNLTIREAAVSLAPQAAEHPEVAQARTIAGEQLRYLFGRYLKQPELLPKRYQRSRRKPPGKS